MMNETNSSQGEANLRQLLSSIKPRLYPEAFMFCSVTPSELSKVDIETVAAIAQEEEGTTLVLTAAAAESFGFDGAGPFAKITLQVHSSLQAVGLTAAVSHALSEVNISANVIAGYHHDHIFVGFDDGPNALEVLEGLSAKYGADDKSDAASS